MKYFIAGHFWLFVAIVLFFGQKPTNWAGHSRFFGFGPELSNPMYFVCVSAVAGFGVFHLYQAWKTNRVSVS